MTLSRCGAHLRDGRRCWGWEEHPGEPHKFADSLPPGPPAPPIWEWLGWYYVDEQGNRLLEPKPAAEASSEETDAGCNRARATMSKRTSWDELQTETLEALAADYERLEQERDALRARLAVAERKIDMLSDPEFWIGSILGLLQVERGETITLEELKMHLAQARAARQAGAGGR